MSAEDVQDIVDAYLKKYKGADDVRVEVHRSAETLPGYRAGRDDGAIIKGEYDSRTDTVHIVAGGFNSSSNKQNIKDVEAALREEILVHKGLGVFSPLGRQQSLSVRIVVTPKYPPQTGG